MDYAILGRNLLKAASLLIVVSVIFLSGCKEQCISGQYASNGNCCSYICSIDCPGGVVQGTCGCECMETSTDNPVVDDHADDNLDNIFGEEDIAPPVIPA